MSPDHAWWIQIWPLGIRGESLLSMCTLVRWARSSRVCPAAAIWFGLVVLRLKLPLFISPRLIDSRASASIAPRFLYLACQGIAHGFAIAYGFSLMWSLRQAIPVV